MASTFVIQCPECNKQMKVVQDLIGKKIRCKECNAVFPVRRPEAAQARKDDKGAVENADDDARAKKIAAIEDDDDDGKNPYALAETDDGIARCPHCAKELESKEARICLHCGYDLVTRVRAGRKAVYEHTSEDKFNWLLPGIICAVVIVILITVSIICMVKTKGWMRDGWFEDDDNKGKWIIRPGCFMLGNGMLTLFVCYHLGRFVYRRLVVDNLPPEQEIEKVDEELDD
jgi:predicted Zn finger-like uncharacterized protein